MTLALLVVACVDPNKESQSESAAEDSPTIPDSRTDTDTDVTSDDTGTTADGDGDGFVEPDDCDDTDGSMYPGAFDEPDNGVDEDCDGVDGCVVDQWHEDSVYVEGDLELVVVGQELCGRGYDGIRGHLGVFGVTGGDLSALACLCEVTGMVQITENPGLESLAGLDRLTMLPDYWEILNNPSLSDLSGLRNVRSVEQFLLGQSPAITSLGPLAELVEVTSFLQVSYLDNLVDLRGLEGLTEVHELHIGGVTALASLHGVGNLQRVSGYIRLSGSNDASVPLESLDGFDSLQDAVIGAQYFDNLTRLGDFPSLTRGGFGIDDNDALSVLDLPPTLAELTYLGVSGNASLLALGDPVSATGIEGSLSIFDNPLLEDLTALEPILSITEDLLIVDNPSLVSLAPLMNVEWIGGDVTITGNTLLPEAEVEAFLAAVGVSNIGGVVAVSGNGS